MFTAIAIAILFLGYFQLLRIRLASFARPSGVDAQCTLRPGTGSGAARKAVASGISPNSDASSACAASSCSLMSAARRSVAGDNIVCIPPCSTRYDPDQSLSS